MSNASNLIVGVILAASVGARAEERPLTLERAMALALERNLELQSQAAEVEVAKARLHGASLLLQGNPELGGAVGPRMNGTASATLDYEVEVSQTIEIAGQRGARIDSANAGVETAEARLALRKGVLAAEVREAFGRALAAEQLLKLQRDAETLAKQALQAAEERQKAGAASRIEVNTARIELGRTIREKTLAVQRRTTAIAELRLLLGIDASFSMGLEGELSIPAEAAHLDEKAVLEAALAHRQDLAALRYELEAAKAEQRLANREWAPSPRIGGVYKREEAAQIVQGTVSIELPVFNRNQGARGVASVRVLQAERAFAALRQRIEQEAHIAASRHDAAHEAAQAYAGGIVQAMQENLALIDEGYRAGKIDFFQLLVIRRETIDARRGYIEALEELNSSEAQLSRTIGRLP